MNFDEIDDAETLTAGTLDAAKSMEHMTDMSLNISIRKPRKYVRTLCLTINPHWFGSFSDDGSSKVKPNRFLMGLLMPNPIDFLALRLILFGQQPQW